MKPYLQFSALCDDVGRTSDGKLILYGIFEGIVSQTFPATHRACYVCNRWTGVSGQFTEHIRIQTAEGGSVAHGPKTDFSLGSRSSVHTVVCRLEGLKFERPGSYWVQVLLDDAVVCEYALSVLPPEAKAQQPGSPVAPVKPPVQD